MIRAYNIIWDIDDEDEDVDLPSEIEIPPGMTNDEEIKFTPPRIQVMQFKESELQIMEREEEWKQKIEKENIQIGYSNSRTCEIGLTTNAGIPYVSIAYLVDECTKVKINQ